VCRVGDIILIRNYQSQGVKLGQHSFIVIADEPGEIRGLSYDIICNVMSSFKNEEQRKKKLKFPGNFPISHDDSKIKNNDGIDGFVKAEQLYYFKKDKIDYIVIGKIKEDIFNLLLDFIETELDVSLEDITDNL
jgi:hypothetical protein